MKSYSIDIEENEKDDFPVHNGQSKSTMTDNSATQSSELCQECSLCCNGTIFSYISISSKEHDSLSQLEVIKKDNKISMSLPCPYLLSGSCSVYEERPKKCGSYSCDLLDRVISGEMSLNKAKKIVSITKQQVSWLRSNISTILDISVESVDDINLRDSLYDVYEMLFNRNNTIQAPSFNSTEYEFCLHALDYIKGLAVYFHRSSLLDKYNNLIIKMGYEVKDINR